jgi:beta-lactam-binding protein with PASTA domain
VQAVAGEGLRLMGVPPDVPQEIASLEQKDAAAKAKLRGRESAPAASAETDPVAALSTPPEDEELSKAAELLNGGDKVDLAGAPVALTGPKVPNFVGQTVKRAMQEAAENGLDLELLGDGLARAQYPPAGAALVPGEHVRVRFAR